MASVHIHITDTKGAIDDGTIPGTFSTDRTLFTFTPLEYRTQRQQISWTVKIRLFRGGHAIPITDEALSGGAVPKCRAEIIVESFVVNAAGTGKIRDITVWGTVMEGRVLPARLAQKKASLEEPVNGGNGFALAALNHAFKVTHGPE